MTHARQMHGSVVIASARSRLNNLERREQQAQTAPASFSGHRIPSGWSISATQRLQCVQPLS